MFGWCVSGCHKECPEKYQKFYIGPVGKGRRKREGVVLLDEWQVCACVCHLPEDERPKKTAPRKTRRKK